MLKMLATAAAILATAPSAMAQIPAGVVDNSFTEPDGDRVIQLSTVVPAAAPEVWAALASAEGWRRLGVQSVTVDFRVGGVIETNYRPGVPAGDPGNIKNEIVAYVPERVLVIRNVKAPPGFAFAEEFSRTATVIELRQEGPGTRVTLTGTGFAPGAAYDDLYAKFRGGNAYSLDLLRKSYGGVAQVPAEPAKRVTVTLK